MKFKTLSILLIFLILLLSGCDSKSDKGSSSSLNSGVQKQYVLNTVSGNPLKIGLNADKILVENANDKLVLLNFFTTWCPACKVEISNLVKLQESFQNDIIVIGVLLEDFKTNEELSTFLNQYSINYAVTNSPEAFDLAKSLGGLKAVPTLFLVDKKGNIFQKYTGLVPNEMMEIDIKKLLEK